MDDRDGDRPSWDGKHSVPSCLNGLLKDEAEKSLQLQSSLCSGNGKQDLLFFVGLQMCPVGISSNTTGWRVMSSVPTGRWDISRFHWREESRSTAAKSSGFGKKNPAVIVRDIIDHMHASVPLQLPVLVSRLQEDKAHPVCTGQWWVSASDQHMLLLQGARPGYSSSKSVMCYLSDGKAYNSDQTIFVLSALCTSLMRSRSKRSFLPLTDFSR